jgi:hypothetical protein
MDWESATTKDDGTLSIPGRWLLLHYYEALNILFRMENALRVFVYVVLKNHFHERWEQTNIKTTDDEQTTIASAASKRQAQARGFGYLGYEIASPLMYLNSGELTNLICSDAYWTLFKPFFRGKKDIMKNKLDEIGTVRNALAHFRPIKYDDIELIKQNIKHAFAGIEQCLTEMTQTPQPIPSNTEGEWYKSLMTLGSSHCAVQLFQNSSEKWVRCEITYTCATVREASGARVRRLLVTRLITPAIIKSFPELARHCTFVTEYVSPSALSADKKVTVGKQVGLIFSKSTVVERHVEIASQLRDVLTKIEGEMELVQSDNLARGQLIDLVRILSRFEEREGGRGFWKTTTDNLKCEFGENDPPEYWGNIGLFESDFIAGAVRYPWMPSDISKEDEIPF